MSNLAAEILLRVAKVLAATGVGLVVYALATTAFAADGSVELALLSWLVGAGVILLAETSPI